MPFDNIIQVLNEAGTGVTNRSRQLFEQKGGNASGRMSRETKHEVKQTATAIEMVVDTVSYFRYADEGRGPTRKVGTGEVKKNIRKWIDQKGISPKGLTKDELAFLIARKIHKEGYEGKFYVSDVVSEQFKREMDSKIADAIIKDFNF